MAHAWRRRWDGSWVCFTYSRILTFLNVLQIQVEWSWSRKLLFQLLIFVFVGEQVGQVDPEGDQAGQEPQQWYGLAGDLLETVGTMSKSAV